MKYDTKLSKHTEQTNSVKRLFQGQQHMFTVAVQFLKNSQHKNANTIFFQNKIKQEVSFKFYKELSYIVRQVFRATDKKLINFINKFQTDEILQLKELQSMKKYVLNANPKVKLTLDLLFFLNKIKSGIQIKQIITQFHHQNIQNIMNSLNYQSSCILKAKIYTVLVLAKYRLQQFRQGQKLILIQNCVKQRKKYENLIPENLQFMKTTFYLSTVLIDTLIGSYINRQHQILQLLKQEEKRCNNSLLNESYKQVYLNNLHDLKEKFKKNIMQEIIPIKKNKDLSNTPKNQKNFFQTKLKLEESDSHFYNQKSSQKLEQFCKRTQKRLFNQNSQTNSKESLSSGIYSSNKLQKSKSMNLRGMYKHIFQVNQDDHHLSYNPAKQKAYKSRSLVRQKDQSLKNLLSSSLSKKIQIYLEYEKMNKHFSGQQNNRRKKKNLDQSRASSQDNTNKSIDKIPQNSRISKNSRQKLSENSQGAQINKQISQFKKNGKAFKKKKIASLYKAFAFNNKVIDICQWKLCEQKQRLQEMVFFQKYFVKETLTHPIKEFQAGIKKQTQKYEQLITTKCQFKLKFIKFWLEKLLICEVKLSQIQKIFTLQIQINSKKNKIILHRGNNILCERFITIWPTLRYLIQKKIFQFGVFKRYQDIFMQVVSKKNDKKKIKKQKQKQSFKDIENKLFSKYFGDISKEQAEQITFFLDFCYKFICLISHRQKKENSFKEHVKNITQDVNFQLSQNQAHLQVQMKRNSKLQLNLMSTSDILLCTFFNKSQNTFFFIKVFISKYQILKMLQDRKKNKKTTGITVSIYFRSNFRKYDCSSVIELNKIDLKNFHIKIEDFFQQITYFLKFGRFACSFSQNFYNFCINKLYIHSSLGISTIQSKPLIKSARFTDLYISKKVIKSLIEHQQTEKTELYPISITQNCLDLFSWHLRANNILLPNSKWRIVQKKIKNILSFMTHLSKVTRRKSSLLASQKIRQYKQVQDSKKVQYKNDGFSKSRFCLQQKTVYYLEKIQNHPCKIRVSILQEIHANMWIAQILIFRSNSKNLQKFYISLNDFQLLNRPIAKINKRKQKDAQKKQQNSISNSNSRSIISDSNISSIVPQKSQYQKPSVEQSSTIFNNFEAIKMSDPKMVLMNFIKRIDFMKQNCFQKVFIHGDFQDFRLNQKIASNLKDDLQKGHLKHQYLAPFQHYFQTIISKPVRVQIDKKKQYVMLTLIKLRINSKVYYQFKMILKEKQFHYAFQMSQKSMIQLLNLSSSQSINKSFQGFNHFMKEQGCVPSIVINLNESQKSELSHNFYQSRQSKLLVPEKRTSILSKIPQIFQPTQQDSLLSLIRCLYSYSKQVFQTLMQNIKIQQISSRMVLIIYKKKKIMHKRILQQINTSQTGLQIVQIKQQHQDLRLQISSDNFTDSYSNIFRSVQENQNQDLLSSFRLVLLNACPESVQQILEKQIIVQMQQEETLQRIQFQNQKRCIKYGSSGKKIKKMAQIFMKFYESNMKKY